MRDIFPARSARPVMNVPLGPVLWVIHIAWHRRIILIVVFDGCTMLSKCANPECAEKFLFLRSGKLFCLAPTPEIEVRGGALSPLRERFWLCNRCAKLMTVAWDGTQVKLIPLPKSPAKATKSDSEAARGPSPRRRAAHAGIDNT